MLAGFLLVHTIGNSTIFWGRSAFNAYAHHLHSLGIFVPIFEIGLYSIFFLHVITGIILFLENRKARGGQQYAVYTSAGGRTIGSKTMIYTGAAIFIFILIHLANFHFVQKTETKTISDFVTQVLNNPFFTLIYGAGICLLFIHISHGFWSMLQTFGISHPKYDYPLRVVTWAMAGVMGGVFLLITLVMVISRNQLL